MAKKGTIISAKQKKFAELWLQTNNATRAAIEAGYAKKYAHTNASKLLDNTAIKQYIEERLKSIEGNLIANSNEVLIYLTKVMRGEEKDQFERDASLSDRTKAAELLGKRYSLFTDKVDMSAPVRIVIEDDYGD